MRGIGKWLVGFLFVISLPAHSSVDTGLSWLKAQRANDGSFSALDTSSTLQGTAEAVYAFVALGEAPPSSTLTWIGAANAQTTEAISRKIVALAASGSDVTTQITLLAALQNSDGGFGESFGFQSTTIDTAYALAALAAANVVDTALLSRAIGFIQSTQLADGSFGLFNASTSSVYVTATVSTVLQKYRMRFLVSETIDAANRFLVAQRSAVEGWGSDWESALALRAVIPATTDATLYDEGVNYLLSKQQADGSWSGSEYATALVLQALYLAEKRPAPPEPGIGAVSGQLVDGGSNLPIRGAHIVLAPTNQETRSTIDGGFELEGIAPGDYTLECIHDGYETDRRSVRVDAGKRLDIGTIPLGHTAAVGLLKGTVTAGVTGEPLVGVSVQVTGNGGGWEAFTATDGGYQVVVPPGMVTLLVTASGYELETASGTVNAGGTLTFSPVLRTISFPANPLQTVVGRALDNVAVTPLAGAQILVNGSSAITGIDGTFSVSGLTDTELDVEVRASGYKPVHLLGVVASGGILDLGDLRLVRDETVFASTVSGIVRDAETGAPISGAMVSIGVLSTTCDAAGYFRIGGIQSLVFNVTASAAGYFSQHNSVTLLQQGYYVLPLALERTAFSGLGIGDVFADQSSYPAYSQVHLTAVLKNTADASRSVHLRAKILGPEGVRLEEFVILASPAGGGEIFEVAAGESRAISTDWFNRNYPPGTYHVWIQAFDATTAELLSERAMIVVVNETRRVEYARLASNVTYANQGEKVNVDVLLSVLNRSNVPIEFLTAYEWRDQKGDVVHSGRVMSAISTETLSTTIHIDSFEHAFASPGRYPFVLQSIEGLGVDAYDAGAIDVGPDIRIEPTQSVSPGTIVPDTDSRVRIKIRIDGVQAP